jgi:uncharacterized protein
MSFWKKEQKVEALVLKHLGKVVESLGYFQDGLAAYLEGEDSVTVESIALSTHRAESRADDIRRDVETELISGALLAPSRRDILEVIEMVDRLANAGEEALNYLLLQNVHIPTELNPILRQIAAKTEEITVEVKTSLHMLFENLSGVLPHTKAIENKESEVDHLEREAIRQIFTMEIDLAEKLQLRGVVLSLVEISDRAEDLSDRIDIMVAQRKL